MKLSKDLARRIEKEHGSQRANAAVVESLKLRGNPETELRIELPWPVTVNHYYQIARKRLIITPAGEKFRGEVAVACRNHGHIDCRFGAWMYVYPPDERRFDLDNLWKSTLDSLQHCGTFRDDSMMDDQRAIRCEVRPPGSVTVLLFAMDGPIEDCSLRLPPNFEESCNNGRNRVRDD